MQFASFKGALGVDSLVAVFLSRRSVPIDMLNRRFMPPNNLILGPFENGGHSITFLWAGRPSTQYYGKDALRIKARSRRQFVRRNLVFFAQIANASWVSHV